MGKWERRRDEKSTYVEKVYAEMAKKHLQGAKRYRKWEKEEQFNKELWY